MIENQADESEPSAPSIDSPFVGWETLVPQFVHGVKVAIVEALLYMGEPLSAAQMAKLFRGAGDEFREANVRYHLGQLVKAGVLQTIKPDPLVSPSGKEKLVYFTNGVRHAAREFSRQPS